MPTFLAALFLLAVPLQTPTAPAPAAPQAAPAPAAAAKPLPRDEKLPPSEAQAKAALEKSPRHGEYVDIKLPAGGTPIRTWIVYPERKDKAGVVILVHEIYGLSDWLRGVADQLAKDGFIAVAPDLISGLGPNGGGTESAASRDDVVKLVRQLTPAMAIARLDAVRDYAVKLPSANGKSATIGFCWGGGQSFAYAVHQPSLAAAVVYYGTPPETADLAKIKAPVARLLRRRRRPHHHHRRSDRGRDEEARQDLRAARLRRSGPRLPARAGGSQRGEPQGHPERLAADGGVSDRPSEVTYG